MDTQKTLLQNERGISVSNLIRIKNGLIQKLGGCQKLCTTPVEGAARAAFAWADLEGNPYLAIGTTELLYLYYAGVLNNITPVTATSNLTNGFSTVMGSSIVTVDDIGQSPSVGNWINIVNATYIGGVFLQGPYQVLTASAPNYTIDSGIIASSTVNSGGTTVDFTTTMGQQAVAITLGAYAFFNTQDLTIGVSTTVGGVTLFGQYEVTVTAGPTYSITANGTASSSTSAFENTGETRVQYFLALPTDTIGIGSYGSGLYGDGLYGVGSATINSTDQVQWSLDKWGENLVAAYRTGTIYQWVPPVATNNVATPVSGAPQAVNGIMTASPEQQEIAWGIYSASLGEQDPLLVGFCDIANLNQWTASATNQAGTFRLSSGSLIVGGLWIGLAGLLWTDVDVWSMAYIGFPLVYSFNKLAPNCGLISQRARAVLGTIIAWMSFNDFFVYSGGAISPIPCTVRDFVFNNLDRNFTGAIFAAPNTYYGEIAWWFPTIGSNGIPNAYVKWNPTEAGEPWDYGYQSLQVDAWTDQSVLGPPIGIFSTGLIEQFETAIDFDGSILDSGFMSGWFELAEGEQFLFIERIFPDFVISSGGEISMTVYLADDMAATLSSSIDQIRTYGPFMVTASTPFFIVGGRGRLCQIQVQCTSANTFYRYGKPLAVVAADGRQ